MTVGKHNEVKKEEELPVYEGQLVDDEEAPKPASRDTGSVTAPAESLPYKLGKLAGGIAAVWGFVNEVRRFFAPANPRGYGEGRGMGSGKGRGKGKRRRMKQRQKQNSCR